MVLVHEATLGGMSPDAARHLRYLGRTAAANGTDGTDYSRSYTAKSFVPHYTRSASPLPASCGEPTEFSIKGISKQSHANLRHVGA